MGLLQDICKLHFDQSNHVLQLTYFMISKLYAFQEKKEILKCLIHIVTTFSHKMWAIYWT